MYREYHQNEAKKFKDEYDCYIHVEMKDGDSEQYVSGNVLAVMWSLMMIINRTSFDTDNSFEASLALLKQMYDDYVEMLTG